MRATLLFAFLLSATLVMSLKMTDLEAPAAAAPAAAAPAAARAAAPAAAPAAEKKEEPKHGEAKGHGEKHDDKHKKHEAHPHWSYECKKKGDLCPKNWGKIKMPNNQCGSTKRQSPINLPTHFEVGNFTSWSIETDYESLGQGTEVINNGHTVQVNYPDQKKSHFKINFGSGSKPGVDGGVAEYKLLQFHFHTPSEHTIDGEHAPLEMHMVHKKVAGPKEAEPFAVLGFFFAEGFKNHFLESFFKDLPSPPSGHADMAKKTLRKSSLVQLNRMVKHVSKEFMYFYKGGLTTPPCSEAVQFCMIATPLTASISQIDDVVANLPEAINNRPVQPLGSEQIIYVTPASAGAKGAPTGAAPMAPMPAPKH